MPSGATAGAYDNPSAIKQFLSVNPLAANTRLKSHLELAQARITVLALPRGLAAAAHGLGIVRRLLANIARRLEEGASAPLRLALFGPTGVGKSKLFNSLLGEVVSPAGFRRPFTTRPVYSLHARHVGLSSRVDGKAHTRSGDLWPDIVFIDTPDFDSVESSHRAEAERVFCEAEAFLFVTDVQKYADQSTWEYIDRLHAENKPVVMVLNKSTGGSAASDFRSRLARRIQRDDLIVIDEQPIDDATLIPATDAGLEQIRTRIRAVFGTAPERRTTMIAAFDADVEQLRATWLATSARLRDYQQGIAALRSRLTERFARAGVDLASRVAAPIDEGVKAEVYARVLERIKEIDILRYPRRLLALPFEGIKLLAAKWWPSREKRHRQSPEEAQRQQALERFEACLLSLCDESRLDLQSELRCPELLKPEEVARLRIPHDQLAGLFDAREKEFREWLEREAKETASKLTNENKLKFILSQVIYNSVALGVQFHTGGHLTLLEAATSGVLSPLFAKAVGMAVSSEKVGQFEKRAHAHHQRLLGELLIQARARFEAFLDEQTTWVTTFEELSRCMELLESSRAELLRMYEADPGAVASGGEPNS